MVNMFKHLADKLEKRDGSVVTRTGMILFLKIGMTRSKL